MRKEQRRINEKVRQPLNYQTPYGKIEHKKQSNPAHRKGRNHKKEKAGKNTEEMKPTPTNREETTNVRQRFLIARTRTQNHGTGNIFISNFLDPGEKPTLLTTSSSKNSLFGFVRKIETQGNTTPWPPIHQY